MAFNIVRTLRRLATGAEGPPTTMGSGVFAVNEKTGAVYYGAGENGAGDNKMATSIIEVAGERKYATKVWVGEQLGEAGGGDMSKAVYDTDNDGIVDRAEVADSVDWSDVQNPPATYEPSPHSHTKAEIGLSNAANLAPADYPISDDTAEALLLKANLTGANFTGPVSVPNVAGGNSGTSAANTAFVMAAIQAIIGMAPADLDTLVEIAARIQAGEGNDAALVASIATKLTKTANLSDLQNVATALNNLGIKGMGLQEPNNVAITGGTISGVVLDQGYF